MMNRYEIIDKTTSIVVFTTDSLDEAIAKAHLDYKGNLIVHDIKNNRKIIDIS